MTHIKLFMLFILHEPLLAFRLRSSAFSNSKNKTKMKRLYYNLNSTKIGTLCKIKTELNDLKTPYIHFLLTIEHESETFYYFMKILVHLEFDGNTFKKKLRQVHVSYCVASPLLLATVCKHLGTESLGEECCHILV